MANNDREHRVVSPLDRAEEARTHFPEADFSPGVEVGQYRLRTPLGAGGMGVAWLADDIPGRREVVLKFIPPQLQQSQAALRRTERAFQAVHALHDRYICPTYQFFHDPRFGSVVVMQRADGQSLELLSGRLPLEARDPAYFYHALKRIPPAMIVRQSDEVNGALRRALAKAPEDRFETCTAFVEALEGREAIRIRRVELEGQREDAESLRRQCKYDEALDVAQHMAAAEDPRLQDLTDWSTAFIESTRAEKARREQQRDDAFSESRALLDQGKAKEALSRVAEIDSALLRDGEREEVSRLQHIVEEERKLLSMVAVCKAGGGVSPDDAGRLLEAAVAYLQLNPHHQAVLDLQDQLVRRIAKKPKEHVSALAKVSPSAFASLPATVVEQLPLLKNSIGMQLVRIPAGEFWMGVAESDKKATSDEQPQHRVRITEAFFLGSTVVTQEQWEAVMGTQPWRGEERVKEGAD